MIAPMTEAHWPAVRAIYAAGIATGNATFETEPPQWPQWDAAHHPRHRLVALDGDRVLGWTAVASVSARRVYAGVVESSVYVHPDSTGQGIGHRLLMALVASTEDDGIWTIQTGIFRENAGSIALHERAGFRVVGVREKIGRHYGRWRDVVFMERRSTVVD